MRLLLIFSAVLETGMGLAFLVIPALPMFLLFGQERLAPVEEITGRIAGGAIFSLGMICWVGRNRDGVREIVVGLLIYHVVLASLLTYGWICLTLRGAGVASGTVLHLGGIVWCSVCLNKKSV